VNVTEALNDALDRLPDLIRGSVEGLSPEQLRWAPAAGANPVGWLVWHLTRVQDHHVADLLGEGQVYISGDWAKRFGVAPDESDIGYGHSAADVAAVHPESWQALVEYYTAVADRTRDYVGGLSESDLDRVVDDSWDPPVTLGVRLISVLNDDTQHVGQAAYVRGLLPED
jgi:uncharacterized damage-inducible protein DinB